MKLRIEHVQRGIDLEAAAGGVKRVLAGVIDVTLFGLGGLVEKVIVSNVEKSYDDAAAFTAQWLTAKRSRASLLR